MVALNLKDILTNIYVNYNPTLPDNVITSASRLYGLFLLMLSENGALKK